MRARIAETERLSGRTVATGSDFWDSRARHFAASLSFERAAGDPFLRRLRRAVGTRTTVIDVGAGAGRFALHVAGRAGQVTAVDPSPKMLGILRRQAGRLGLDNLHTVVGRWHEVAVGEADVVFSSYVLPVVDDAAGFLTKVDAAATRHAFLYLGAFSADAVVDPLWRHFHGAPRRPGPSYLDALAVLHELGIAPDVEVVEVKGVVRYASLREAAKSYGDHLLLPDSREVRKELEGLLAAWLVRRRDGLASPLPVVPAAVIHWQPAGAAQLRSPGPPDKRPRPRAAAGRGR